MEVIGLITPGHISPLIHRLNALEKRKKLLHMLENEFRFSERSVHALVKIQTTMQEDIIQSDSVSFRFMQKTGL
jgi:hypothetical protein